MASSGHPVHNWETRDSNEPDLCNSRDLRDLGALAVLETQRGEDGMSTRSRSLRILAQMLGALLVVGGGISGVAPTRAADTGHIYVTLEQPPQIMRVDDMTGAGLTTLGTPGTGADHFVPAGILVDGADRIYVVDHYNGRIVLVNDMTGAGWTTLGSRGSGVNQFDRSGGIFVDGAGRIYVADFGNSRIVRVNDMTGAGWTTLRTPGKINFEIFVR